MRALVVRAERGPRETGVPPRPHEIYVRPQFRVEERTLGAVPAGHVRVEMRLVGVCGSDLNVVECDPATGYLRGSTPLDIGPEGRILGHEAVGRVREVGPGVSHISRDAWVLFESLRTCRHCEACRKGHFNQCEAAALIGMQQDGVFATLQDIAADLVHDVGDLAANEAGLRAAACIEPAACAFVAASRTQVRPGDAVLIFGAGPIGLFTAMLCRLAFGAARVELVEPLPFRREIAAQWADRAYDVDEYFGTPTRGPVDVVIETSGDLSNINRACRRIGPNGRIALLARRGEPLNLEHVDHVITNGISIAGSRGHLGGAVADLLNLYRAARLPLHEAVTEVVDGLDGLKRRLDDPAALRASACKVLARL